MAGRHRPLGQHLGRPLPRAGFDEISLPAHGARLRPSIRAGDCELGEHMMKIIVNCGPCREFIAKCVASIVSQTFTDWQAYVTVDPYGDGTFEEAMLARRDDSRIDILQNRKRLFAMLNLKHAIERSEAHPDDIIVVLDGDDWFATPDALRIIHDAYRRPECWMTYGSWIADQPD